MLERYKPNLDPSRREIIKAGVGVGALAIISPVADFLLGIRQRHIETERAKRLPATLEVNIPDNSVCYGICPDHNITQSGLALAKELEAFPQYFVFFLPNLPDDETKDIYNYIKEAADNGIIPIISLGFSGGLTDKYSEFTNFLHVVLKRLDSYDCPYILRPFFEMTAPWGKDWWGVKNEQEFVNGWKEMYEFIHANSQNAKVAFCVNSTIYDLDPTNPHPFTKWFPGEKYIDWMTIDVYDKSSTNITSAEHRIYLPFSAKIIIGPDIKEMRGLAPNTPIAVTEIGTFENDSFIEDATDYLLKLGINFWAIFAWNKERNLGEKSWDPRNYTNELKKYKKELARSCYIRKSIFP